MALVNSLLTAIVRSDGDALVMHVGETPYVVAPSGPIELSTHGLNLQAMAGMVAELLPAEMQRSLLEFGAVEHELPVSPAMQGDRFTVVVARGGDDVWIEIRRQRRSRAAVPHIEGALAIPAPMMVSQSAIPAAQSGSFTELSPSVAVMTVPEVRPVAIGAAPSGSAVNAAAPVMPPVVQPRPVEPVAQSQGEADGASALANASPLDERVEAATTLEPEGVEAHCADDDWSAGSPLEVERVSPAAPPPPVEIAEPVEAADLEGAMSFPSEPAAPPHEQSGETQGPAAEFATPTEEPVGDENSVLAEAPATVEAVAVAESAAAFERSSAAAATGTEAAQPAYVDSAVSKPAPATVIPMRTLRIEVPPGSSSRRAGDPSEIARLLRAAADRGATALYLTTDASPFVRIDDDVHVLDGEPPLVAADVELAARELMPGATAEALRPADHFEWVSNVPDIGAVRCSTFRDHRGPGAIFQLIPVRPIVAAQLGLSGDIQALTTEAEGLVLVSSPPGHGKTTLMGALVDLINRQRPGYIITLEQQIRLVHEHHTALVSQREVPDTADQILTAARGALKENPDVLVVEDVASADVFRLAVDAADAGRLVFVSVTAASATAALARVVEWFSSEKRSEIESLLAERLLGVISQVRLRKTGGGRAAAREVVLATAAVSRAIRDGLQDLPLAIEEGRKHGLVSLTDSLVQLVRSNTVDIREAYRRADDREAFLLALTRENVDTSALARFV